MYHVLMALQCIYRHSDEGSENGDGKEGIPGGKETVKIADDAAVW